MLQTFWHKLLGGKFGEITKCSGKPKLLHYKWNQFKSFEDDSLEAGEASSLRPTLLTGGAGAGEIKLLQLLNNVWNNL